MVNSLDMGSFWGVDIMMHMQVIVCGVVTASDPSLGM